MNEDLFDPLEQTLRCQGPRAGFDLLIRELVERKNYPLFFEARLMQKRHEMGLPLIHNGSVSDLPPEQRPVCEAILTDAARETGNLFLADGDIVRAWPYFRAIGDAAPVAEAIEKAQAGEGIERVIEIALHEGANPRKGFELLLERRGICQAIDFALRSAGQDRAKFLQVLVRALCRELAAHLKEAIAGVEGQAPEAGGVAELIAGRDWLFDGAGYYVENSHLASILQASPELEDRESLRLAVELADYGRRLAPMFHFQGAPPFEDLYLDHAVYLRALLGEDVDAAIAHFRKKLAAAVSGAAEVLVSLLARVGRYEEAIAISVEHLRGAANGCPSAIQLCHMAGDFTRVREVAREQGELLAFAAGVIQS